MATKTRKQKRRQRGGKTIQVKSRNYSKDKITYNPPDGTTMRQLVERYFDNVMLGEGPIEEMLRETLAKTNPRLNIYSGNKRLNLKDKWNEPYSFDKDLEVFEIYAHVLELTQEIERQQTEHVLPFILELMNKLKGGKIIWGSSTVTSDIEKNVAQQFDFRREPTTPIIHIDPGFFTPDHEPYEFYTLLDFQEKPTVGTRDFVRHYTKPAGVYPRLRSETPSEYEEQYYEELGKQAARNGFNLKDKMDIYCVKYWTTQETIKILQEHAAKTGFQFYTWSQT